MMRSVFTAAALSSVSVSMPVAGMTIQALRTPARSASTHKSTAASELRGKNATPTRSRYPVSVISPPCGFQGLRVSGCQTARRPIGESARDPSTPSPYDPIAPSPRHPTGQKPIADSPSSIRRYRPKWQPVFLACLAPFIIVRCLEWLVLASPRVEERPVDQSLLFRGGHRFEVPRHPEILL